MLLYKEILACTELPPVQDNIPYTLMPFQFSRYQHRFFSTWPILQSLWQPSKRSRSFANARRFVRFLHSIRNRFSAPQGGASQLAYACVTTVGRGKFRKVWCPGQFKLAECFPVFSLWFFWVSWVHFFFILNTSPMAMPYSRFIFVKRTMHHFKGFDIFQIWAPKLRTYIFIIAVPLGSCLSGFDVGHSFKNAWAISSLLTVSGAS